MAENISRYRRAIATAEELRREARRQTEAIRVTLDWAEQQYTAGPSSNVWDGYFQTFERLDQIKHQRADPIRDYLDQFGQ